jgi:hypothetical protein
VDAPVRKDLTLNASVRADKYSDLGESTVNPKLSLRWQPAKNLVTAWRRPTPATARRALPEIYTKETERTLIPTFNDPINSTTGQRGLHAQDRLHARAGVQPDQLLSRSPRSPTTRASSPRPPAA